VTHRRTTSGSRVAASPRAPRCTAACACRACWSSSPRSARAGCAPQRAPTRHACAHAAAGRTHAAAPYDERFPARVPAPDAPAPALAGRSLRAQDNSLSFWRAYCAEFYSRDALVCMCCSAYTSPLAPGGGTPRAFLGALCHEGRACALCRATPVIGFRACPPFPRAHTHAAAALPPPLHACSFGSCLGLSRRRALAPPTRSRAPPAPQSAAAARCRARTR
jgi:hypothetical protein